MDTKNLQGASAAKLITIAIHNTILVTILVQKLDNNIILVLEIVLGYGRVKTGLSATVDMDGKVGYEFVQNLIAYGIGF